MQARRIIPVIKNIISHPYFIWGLIGFGVLVRLIIYLENRSFWLDEVSLVLNIVELDLNQLHEPLKYGQAAPILFLYISKILANIFGVSELTLRFIPFIGGCLALVAFYSLARETLSVKAVPLALLMLAISRYPIYYSAEFKQYSTDLLCTIIILLLAHKVYKSGFNHLVIALFAVAGVFVQLVSHTSIFILAGSGLALFIELYINKGKYSDKLVNNFVAVIFMGSIWLLSFGVNYYLLVRNTAHDMFYDFWESGFAPFLPSSISEVLWYPTTLLTVMSNPMGFSLFRGLALLAFFVGIYVFYKKKYNFQLALLLLPLLIILLASMFEQYPIRSRLVLFTLPIFYLFIAEGLYKVYSLLRKEHFILGILFLLLFYAYPNRSSPLIYSLDVIKNPAVRQRQEIKESLAYLADNLEPKDVIYVYYGARRAYDYYTLDANIQNEVIYGLGSRSEPVKYLKELESLTKGRRYWFLFYHVHSASGVNEEQLFLIYLDKIGTQLDAYSAKGSSVYLYELD